MSTMLETEHKPEAEKLVEVVKNLSEKDQHDLAIFLQGVRYAESKSEEKAYATN